MGSAVHQANDLDKSFLIPPARWPFALVPIASPGARQSATAHFAKLAGAP
jgi:hypothetical protein